MTSVQQIKNHQDTILKLLNSTNDKGEKFRYGEILTIVGLEVNKTNRRTLSKLANNNGIRKRKYAPRVKKVKDEIVETGTLFPVAVSDKERFLDACRAFADVYFKED